MTNTGRPYDLIVIGADRAIEGRDSRRPDSLMDACSAKLAQTVQPTPGCILGKVDQEIALKLVACADRRQGLATNTVP